jgi:NAD(P)-dependent dehydrogenase (short-subunit alcohol dehydrogenase family)
VAKHGGIDVLIHTVGTWDGTSITDLEFDRWQSIMDINLTSTFLVFREALRLRAENPDSGPLRLIAFGSGQGADRGAAEQAPYSASKAGVIRLVESVAAEYMDNGVTTHAIAPSVILFDGMEDQKGIPVHDLANLCLVLAGEAGESMSGTTVRAYGTLV